MEIESSYKFDGDAQVSEVADFLRERYMESGGWDITVQGSDVDAPSVTALGGYGSGTLRIGLTETFESDEE